jgi:acyl-coenzyme A synthetase/AMP-(fatty) acid ligase
VAFLANRVVPLMLDASLEFDLMKELIKIYNPEFLWIPQDRIENFAYGKIVFSSDKYCLIELQPDSVFPLYDELALLLTTSGSTGSPKLVRLSYDNVLANAESIAEYLSITSFERPITTLPMNYSFGLSIINSHLLKGATLLLTSFSIMQKEFWNFLNTERTTSISGVPYTYEMLKRLRFFRMDLPSLKTMTQAGGKLNFELNKEFAEYCQSTNKRFFVMYGQTEATARMSYLPYEQSLSKLGSIGISIPGGEFDLIDENGFLFHESDRVGELVYRGRNVSLGYAECGADLSLGDENKGELKTGDLAKRDADNYFYIVGRKKRFVKLYGNRVNLDETERLLKNLMHDCACTGIDDKMVIYITDEDRLDEVKKYISTKTGINHSAFVVKHIEAIPKNSSGKTIYSKLEI